MPTKSIRLTDEEADELRRLRTETGEEEDALLKRAALRGLRDLRLDQGVRAFLDGQSTAEAAAIAGLPRAPFLQALIDRGVVVLDGPSSLGAELQELARRLDHDRLADLGRRLASSDQT